MIYIDPDIPLPKTTPDIVLDVIKEAMECEKRGEDLLAEVKIESAIHVAKNCCDYDPANPFSDEDCLQLMRHFGYMV